MIRETIITTVSPEKVVHIAPMGVTIDDDTQVIAPFRPSTTLENLRAIPFAVVNYTDDVRIFAGCLTGRRDWPTRPASRVAGAILEQSLAHAEVEVVWVEEDDVRPRFHCAVVHTETHAPFRGFNRAQAAVVEAAILVSRLRILPLEKVKREIAYLEIAIGKTAGPAETEAWGWLMERIADFERETAEGKRA